METKEQIDKMPELTEDESGKMTELELKNILEIDIKKYEEHLIQLEKDKANYEVQLAIDEEIWDIVENPKTFKILKPTFEYETNPRYQELQLKKMGYKLRQERARAKGTMDQFDHEKEMIEADLADKKEKLANLKVD